uniref:Toxin n=1 Tax=Strongyloides stercoralis TaxID=6248 RepID=A0A0K0E518_STRER
MKLLLFVILTILGATSYLDAIYGVIKGQICDGDACIRKGLTEKKSCWCSQKDEWRGEQFIESECVCWGGLG